MESAFENIKNLLIEGGTSGIDGAIDKLNEEYHSPTTTSQRKIGIAQSLEQLETVRSQRRKTYEVNKIQLSKQGN